MTDQGEMSSGTSDRGPWRSPEGELLPDAAFVAGITWGTEDGSLPDGWTVREATVNHGCRDFTTSMEVVGMNCTAGWKECCTVTERIVTTKDGIEFPRRHRIRADSALGVRLNGDLVGAAGFEPTTTSPPDWCATRLRHAPTGAEV